MFLNYGLIHEIQNVKKARRLNFLKMNKYESYPFNPILLGKRVEYIIIRTTTQYLVIYGIFL